MQRNIHQGESQATRWICSVSRPEQVNVSYVTNKLKPVSGKDKRFEFKG